MKENKIYYNYNGRFCKRIIEALGNESLTVKEIMTKLFNQTKKTNGRPYTSNPTTQKTVQILAKYPIFQRDGTAVGHSGVGHNMMVNKYRYIGD
tara:strand:+ start:114 stop:395 length:282 start_codon:yes stop_codon:yes gene_type:complete